MSRMQAAPMSGDMEDGRSTEELGERETDTRRGQPDGRLCGIAVVRASERERRVPLDRGDL